MPDARVVAAERRRRVVEVKLAAEERHVGRPQIARLRHFARNPARVRRQTRWRLLASASDPSRSWPANCGRSATDRTPHRSRSAPGSWVPRSPLNVSVRGGCAGSSTATEQRSSSAPTPPAPLTPLPPIPPAPAPPTPPAPAPPARAPAPLIPLVPLAPAAPAPAAALPLAPARPAPEPAADPAPAPAPITGGALPLAPAMTPATPPVPAPVPADGLLFTRSFATGRSPDAARYDPTQPGGTPPAVPQHCGTHLPSPSHRSNSLWLAERIAPAARTHLGSNRAASFQPRAPAACALGDLREVPEALG